MSLMVVLVISAVKGQVYDISEGMELSNNFIGILDCI